MKTIFLLFAISFSSLSFTQNKGDNSAIDEFPVYSGCNEKHSNNKLKACMSKKIKKLVKKNFNKKLANELGVHGRIKISVLFKVNSIGDVVKIRTKAPHPVLAEEAERVIKLIPKFKPGKQRNKPVSIPFSFPIFIFIQE